MLHVELFVGASSGENDAPDVSSAWPGSHWSCILLLFDQSTAIHAGQTMRVVVRAELGSPQPRYEIEAFLSSAGVTMEGGATASWVALGTLRYPEDALNVNDMADVEMDRFAP